MGGYIRFYRKTFNNPVFKKRPYHLMVWMYLLSNVAFNFETRTIFNRKDISLKPGQGVFTNSEIAENVGCTREYVASIINEFKTLTMLLTVTDHRKTLISIVNWEQYQSSVFTNKNTDSSQFVDSSLTPSLYKNNKNNNNINTQSNDAPIDTDFKKFWDNYPRKVGKAKCVSWWKIHKPNSELVAKMLVTLSKQKQTDQWCTDGGRFIPHPYTWLNQGRWDDDVPDTPKVVNSYDDKKLSDYYV